MLRNVGLRKSVEQPVLDLNFAASQIGSNAAPDSRIDFSRGTNAWFVDSDGLVKKSPHNLITNSETIGGTGWTNRQLGSATFTITLNHALAPNGTLTATKADFSRDNTTQYVFTEQTAAVSATGLTQGSCYIKAASSSDVGKEVHFWQFISGVGIRNQSIATLTSEWQRFELVNTYSHTGTIHEPFAIGFINNVGSDLSVSVLLWGAQLSQHSTPPVDNPYLKTEGSAVYAARLDHDPAWFMSAAQEQNLLEYSEMLDDSGWTKNSVTVTANAETDPLGGTTAEYIFATSPSGAFPSIQGSFDTKKGAVHTVSFYAKAGEIDVVSVGIRTSSGGYVSDPFSNQALTSEWQRFSGTFTATEDTHLVRFFFGSGAKTWSGDQGFYIWGTQIEVGSTASTYHRTEGAPYYGPGATPKGLLIEEARTNLLQQSETFDTTWTDTGCSITADAVLAPSGAVTGDKLIKDAAFGFSSLSQNVTLSSAGGTAIMTVYAKAGERDKIALREGATTGGYAAFDLTNGTVLDESNINDSSITPAGNGWFRILIDVTLSSGTNYGGRIVPLPDGYTSGSVTASFSDDGTSGVYIWGSQIEEGSFPTSYIQTIASTATRNADVATMGPTTGGIELVTNGTFDTDTTGWGTNGGRSNLSVSSGQLIVDVVNASVGFVAKVENAYRPTAVAGRRYRLTADLAVNSGSGIRLSVYSGGSSVASTPIVTGSTLTTVTRDFTAPDGVSGLDIFIDNRTPRATTDELVVDNVSLRELYPFEQYNPAEGTYYIHSKRSTDVNSRFYILNPVADGVSPSEQMYLWHWEGSATTVRWKMDSGGSSSTDRTVTTTLDADMRLAAPYKSNSAALALNGSASSTDTSVTVPPIDKIGFGYEEIGSTNFLNGHIKEVSYYARRLSNEALKALTDD